MKIRIYQIYYASGQICHLDEDLTPYDNSKSRKPEFAEYAVFLKNYQEGKHKEADLTGFVSWKFHYKTRISGRKFLDFINSHPGYDVYFINPSPDNVDLFYNVWYHCEKYHPGVLEFAQKIMDGLSYNIDLKGFRNTEQTALYCNYWVGNEWFWDEYMKFTLPIFNYINSHFSVEERKRQMRSHAWVRYRNAFTYSPFIFERLFSTMLVHKSNIRALHYEYPEEYKHLIAETNHLYQVFADLKKRHAILEWLVRKLKGIPFLKAIFSMPSKKE